MEMEMEMGRQNYELLFSAMKSTVCIGHRPQCNLPNHNFLILFTVFRCTLNKSTKLTFFSSDWVHKCRTVFLNNIHFIFSFHELYCDHHFSGHTMVLKCT